MEELEAIAILFAAVAAFRWVNERFLRLQPTVGLMLVSLIVVIVAAVLDATDFGQGVGRQISTFVKLLDRAEPNYTLLMAVLSCLLFANTMQVSVRDLGSEKYFALGVSAVTIVTTTVVVGFLLPWALEQVDIRLSRFSALMFGAMISPTCLGVVLGLLKSPSPKHAALAGGEALFAVGFATVLCIVIAKTGLGKGGSLGEAGGQLFKELLSGGLVGIGTGAIGYFTLSASKSVGTQMVVTLAVACGSFTLADRFDASAPIATVIAGLVLGLNRNTRQRVGPVWRVVDEILTGTLFVVVGAQLASSLSSLLAPMAVAIAVVLAGRAAAVSISTVVLGVAKRLGMSRGRVIKVLTWGGIPGGVSVALAMAIPHGGRDMFVFMIYGVVAFAMIVQGLTINRV